MTRAVPLGAIRAAVLATLLFPEMVVGQQQRPQSVDSLLTLSVLLEEVRTNNAPLRASRLEAAALATRVRQVSTLPDPSIMVGYQPYSLLTARGVQRSQWRIEQTIPYPGKLTLRGKVAGLDAEVAKLEAKTLEADLLLQVKLTYYELYRIQQHESRILAFQDRLESFAADAAAQYTVGEGTQQAILQAQLERNMLTNTKLELDARRSTAVETLRQLLNRPGFGVHSTNMRVEAPPTPHLDEAALLEIALAQRPEAGSLDAAAKRAHARIALARKEFIPDFGLSLTYFDIGSHDAMPTATGRDAVAIGVSVKVPLQRNRLRAQLEEARLRRDRIEAQQSALQTSIQTQIAELVSRLSDQAKQLSLYTEVLIPLAETSRHATLSAYATGSADFAELLDAEKVLYSLDTGYEDTFARYLNTSAVLERVLAVTSLADLIAP